MRRRTSVIVFGTPLLGLAFSLPGDGRVGFAVAAASGSRRSRCCRRARARHCAQVVSRQRLASGGGSACRSAAPASRLPSTLVPAAGWRSSTRAQEPDHPAACACRRRSAQSRRRRLLDPVAAPARLEQGGRIDDIYSLTSIICLVIFARGRRRLDLRGHEVPGASRTTTRTASRSTVTPCSRSSGRRSRLSLVTVIGIYSGDRAGEERGGAPKGAAPIEVTAEQFEWSFAYPEAESRPGSLRSSTFRSARRRARDAGERRDPLLLGARVAGEAGRRSGDRPAIVVTPTKPGRFPIICTELCGIGHSVMRTAGRRLCCRLFEQWLQDQKAAAGGGWARGRQQVFAERRLRWAATRSLMPVRRARSGRTSIWCCPGRPPT